VVLADRAELLVVKELVVLQTLLDQLQETMAVVVVVQMVIVMLVVMVVLAQ
jgi:hypothetical protein